MQPAAPRTTASQLALNDDVYFCVTVGQGIFLDLPRDEYSAIPISSQELTASDVISDQAIAAALEPHRRDLLVAHLLKESGTESPGFQAYRSIKRPRENVFHPDDQRAFGFTHPGRKNVRVSTTDLFCFLWTSWTASRLLKKRHIHEIVRAVRSRKTGVVAEVGSSDEMKRYAAIFRRLRPWYPAPYRCLYDALALLEFLALKKLFPTWIFGVQAQPFGAHCWVQDGDHLLNESTEYAGQFTPIMAV